MAWLGSGKDRGLGLRVDLVNRRPTEPAQVQPFQVAADEPSTVASGPGSGGGTLTNPPPRVQAVLPVARTCIGVVNAWSPPARYHCRCHQSRHHLVTPSWLLAQNLGPRPRSRRRAYQCGKGRGASRDRPPRHGGKEQAGWIPRRPAPVGTGFDLCKGNDARWPVASFATRSISVDACQVFPTALSQFV